MFEIGNSLLEARSRQELEFRQLETETRIRAKYLQALEEEQFDSLPGDAYARGFLRVYAERLGLDPQVYVDEYDTQFSTGAETTLRKPRRLASQRRRRLESHALVFALAGIVILTGLVIAAWRVGEVTVGDEPGQADASAEAIEPGTSTQPTRYPTPPAELETIARTSAPPDAPASLAPVAESNAGAKLVIIAVDGAAGVIVREPNRRGEIVFSGTVEEGERREFHGVRFHVVADRPEVLAVEVNDEVVAPLPLAPAAFVVTEAGVNKVRAR